MNTDDFPPCETCDAWREEEATTFDLPAGEHRVAECEHDVGDPYQIGATAEDFGCILHSDLNDEETD
jgi:hypothetical protein